MDEQKQKKWYYSIYVLLVAIFVVGPFALPLVWKNPSYRLSVKITVTVLIIALTLFLIIFSWGLSKDLLDKFGAVSRDGLLNF